MLFTTYFHAFAGDLEVGQVPQMITLTFNGAVNIDNIRIYQQIFRDDLINPNGCSIKGTFFVSHKYTNYSAVQVRFTALLE